MNYFWFCVVWYYQMECVLLVGLFVSYRYYGWFYGRIFSCVSTWPLIEIHLALSYAFENQIQNGTIRRMLYSFSKLSSILSRNYSLTLTLCNSICKKPFWCWYSANSIGSDTRKRWKLSKMIRRTTHNENKYTLARLVVTLGRSSFTVRSTSTPPTKRSARRFPSNGVSVSSDMVMSCWKSNRNDVQNFKNVYLYGTLPIYTIESRKMMLFSLFYKCVNGINFSLMEFMITMFSEIRYGKVI